MWKIVAVEKGATTRSDGIVLLKNGVVRRQLQGRRQHTGGV